ncbi:MAG: CPBP family intramembrane glutamic endopeptidase [Cyanobacteriota bacterium]|nr:CPBP family intramembrane glutamic endopeptidase [Cyanobacteriota bacterium]
MSSDWSRLARQPPLLRVLIFLTIIIVVWLPLALPLYWASDQDRLPGGDLIPTALLYLVFLVGLPLWQQRVHQIPHTWEVLGFTGGRRLAQGLIMGIGLGGVSFCLLVAIQLALGWAALNPQSLHISFLVTTALGGVLTALAVGWSEELLFRGWLLWELEQGSSQPLALVLNSLIFALVHFIKPLATMLSLLPQFFGLWLLGMALVWARRLALPPIPRQTSLGVSVGLHGSLVWGYYLVDVADLLQVTGRVPVWVTGVGQNPLAGLLGIILLGLLAMLLYRWSHPSAGMVHPG